MNDEKFINNYLDGTFEVKLIDGEPVIFDLCELKGIGPVMFKTRANKILGTFITDDGRLSYSIVNKWLQNAYTKLNLGYKAFLLECKLILTNNGWMVINSVGEEVTERTLIKIYYDTGDAGDIESVKKHFDRWVAIKASVATEDMMKQR